MSSRYTPSEFRLGHYDDDGHWVKQKYCFVYCGPERCDCGPPNDLWYDEAYDKRLKKGDHE